MTVPLDATAARRALDLAGGASLLLQRVPRAWTADALAGALQPLVGRPVRVARGLDDAVDIAVWDARGQPPATFDAWDPQRATLVPADGARIVLLDVATARHVLQRAPHTASFAGGVTMPPPGAVRGAETLEQAEAGDALLRRTVADHPEHRGRLVGIDLLSERIFAGLPDATPVEVAREHLDEGIIYVGVVR